MDDAKKFLVVDTGFSSLGRRDLIKLGVAGAAMAIPASSVAAAKPALPQAARQVSDAPTGGLQTGQVVQQWPDIAESQEVVASTGPGYTVHTGPGWVNNSGRASGNGPMDVCMRRLVEFASSISESQMTPSLIETFNYLMADSLAVLYTGFESDPARICARLAQKQRGDMKCTVLGYGIVTTPEMAAFANGGMTRHADYCDHRSGVLGGILAIGEALHCTGMQVMVATAIAYEVITTILHAYENPSRASVGHVEFDMNAILSPGVALACSKLMGLNEDQMANAVSLALLPHMPIYSRVGTHSMWKGWHSSEQVRNGVWGALLAQEGFTGPSMPFEQRDGIIAHLGPMTHDFKLPSYPDGRTALENEHENGKGYKRFPCEGTLTGFHETMCRPMREWAKPDEIASLEIEETYYVWQETNDPPKWDPRNRETADHSMPYEIARGLLGGSQYNNGNIYIDNFARDQYMDPKARALMAKITTRPNPDPAYSGTSITVTKTSGEKRVFKAGRSNPMTHEETIDKYNRAAAFRKVDKTQADRILKQWMNLKDVNDIGDAIALAAKFGQPRPLSDKTPPEIA